MLWLASLITDQPELRLDAVVESVKGDAEANPFFAHWMNTWALKVVIGKALGKVVTQLAMGLRELARNLALVQRWREEAPILLTGQSPFELRLHFHRPKIGPCGPEVN